MCEPSRIRAHETKAANPPLTLSLDDARSPDFGHRLDMPTDPEPQHHRDILAILDIIDARIRELATWISEHAPYCEEEQVHLAHGTREQAYWHYGYLMALRDLRRTIDNTRGS
jgi:hypothetical protein